MRAPAGLRRPAPAPWKPATARALARVITAIEDGCLDPAMLAEIRERAAALASPPVVGITGTGGSGKSSLTDELVRRLRLDRRDALRIAVLAVDPSRRKTGGALLGDRIRMNAIGHPNVYMRSLATRVSGSEVPAAFADIVAATRVAGFDIVIVETSGIGQGDAGIVPFVDVPVYVMTPEFGAASQLEKIDMLDFAALVAINKFDRKGAEDALRDVSKQVQRNREAFSTPAEAMPVYGTIASRFNDDGVTALYHRLAGILRERGLVGWSGGALPDPMCAPPRTPGRSFPPDVSAISPRSRRPCASITPASNGRPRSRASASIFAKPAVCSAKTARPRAPPSQSSRMRAPRRSTRKPRGSSSAGRRWWNATPATSSRCGSASARSAPRSGT